MRLLAALAATLLLAANPLATTREAGQQPPAGAAPPGTPAIRITAPENDTYVTGRAVLSAAIEPAAAAVDRVSFFADGRLVCAVERPPFTCPWDAGPGVREHVIRAVAQLPGGGRAVTSVRTRGAGIAEAVEVHVVQVSVLVRDDKGVFVKGLQAKDFRLKEDGVPQRLTHVANEDTPLEVVMALDISASMADAIADVRDSARTFIGALRERDALTILGFNDNIFTVARRETQAEVRLRALDRLAPWGSTSLYDVISRSVSLLRQQAGRKGLVVFSDGEDESSRLSFDVVEKELQSSDAVMYAVGLGRGAKMADLTRQLSRLSDTSGGRTVIAPDTSALSAAFRRRGRRAGAPVRAVVCADQRQARRDVAGADRRGPRPRREAARAAGLSRDGSEAMMRGPLSRATAIASLAAAVLASPDDARGQAAPPAVRIDVTVVARSAAVPALDAKAFTVAVNGAPREVLAAEPAVAPAAGRTFVLAIDETSVFRGAEASLRTAASAIADRLAPGDRLGVTLLPKSRPELEPTDDAAAIEKALAAITGRRPNDFGNFSMGVGEALAISESDTFALTGVADRDCRMPEALRPAEGSPVVPATRTVRSDRRTCVQTIVRNVEVMMQRVNASGVEAYRGLVDLVASLRERPGPKTVILLSAGFAISLDAGVFDELAIRAALSDVAVDAVLVEPVAAPSSRRLVPANIIGERRSLMRRLTELAAAAVGTAHSAVGSGQEAFDRLMASTTRYRLDVRPAADGAADVAAKVAVSVAGAGLTVKVRPYFVPPAVRASNAVATPDARVGQRARRQAAGRRAPGVRRRRLSGRNARRHGGAC